MGDGNGVHKAFFSNNPTVGTINASSTTATSTFAYTVRSPCFSNNGTNCLVIPSLPISVINGGNIFDFDTNTPAGSPLYSVYRIRHSFNNLLANSSFEYWLNGTSVAPNNWTVAGDATVSRTTLSTVGTYGAQIVFGTANTGEMYQDFNASTTVDYTYSLYVQRTSGSGNARLVMQQEGSPYTEFVSVPLPTGAGWQLIVLTGKPSTGSVVRFSVKSTDATASTWVIDEAMGQESKGVATTWLPKYLDDTYNQIAYGNFALGSTTPWATLAVNPTAGNASNQFAVGSSTATNFIVTNAGRVGVGTTTPYTNLSVTGTSSAAQFDAYGTATSTFNRGVNIAGGCFSISGICIGASSGTVTSVATNNGLTGGAITTTGTLGLDISKLNSNSNQVFWDGTRLFSSTSQMTVGSILATTTSTSQFWGNVGISTSTPWAQFAINPIAGQASNQFVVGSSTATNFIITNTGRVGVGTTTPYSPFAVTGTSSAAQLSLYGTATSTSANNGINISKGCYAINGTCVGAGGGSTNAVGGTGAVQYANGTSFAGSNTSLYTDGSKLSVNSAALNGYLNVYAPSDTVPAIYAMTNNTTDAAWFVGGIDNTGTRNFEILNHAGVLFRINGTADLHMDGAGNADIPGTFSAASLYGDVTANYVSAATAFIGTGQTGIDSIGCTDGDYGGGIMYNCSVSSSDIRLKKNVVNLTGTLDKLSQIHPITFNWNDDYIAKRLKNFNPETKKQVLDTLEKKTPSSTTTVNLVANSIKKENIGFSAQEIEKVFPDLVSTDTDGYKTVDYEHFVPILVGAIQEQQVQIDAFKGGQASGSPAFSAMAGVGGALAGAGLVALKKKR